MKNDNPFIESQKIASQFDDATLKQDVDITTIATSKINIAIVFFIC